MPLIGQQLPELKNEPVPMESVPLDFQQEKKKQMNKKTNKKKRRVR